MSERESPHPEFVAFAAGQLLRQGALRDVAIAVKAWVDANRSGIPQVFEALTAQPLDLDLSGSPDDVARRHTVHDAPAPRSGPGRPRLGVVAREVTLLPRHWAWLNEQPGGASAALRRLVEDARRTHADRDAVRRAREAAYRFMQATQGDAPGFEEATRALWANDEPAFDVHTDRWPADIRTHVRALARAVFHPTQG